MAEDLSVKESPYYKMHKSLITTSTPLKSINDSGYNTPSSILSNASSNLNQISEVSPQVSLYLNHTSSSDLGVLQLSSNSQYFTRDHNESKLGDITNKTYSDVNFSLSPCQELSPTKKFKSSLDMRTHFHVNNGPEDDENHFIKRKNSEKNFSPQEHVILQQQRISMEGRENIDIMNCLARIPHVIEKIFSFLSDNDVISVSMVSTTWCGIVRYSPVAQKKKAVYFKLSKENRGGYEGRDRSSFNNKGCLANISNVMRSPSKRDLPQRSPPVSPSKFRIHLYHKVSKKTIQMFVSYCTVHSRYLLR